MRTSHMSSWKAWRPNIFASQAVISSPAIFRIIRNALMEAGIDTSHTTLNLLRIAHIAPKCGLAIWETQDGTTALTECVRTQKVLN